MFKFFSYKSTRSSYTEQKTLSYWFGIEQQSQQNYCCMWRRNGNPVMGTAYTFMGCSMRRDEKIAPVCLTVSRFAYMCIEIYWSIASLRCDFLWADMVPTGWFSTQSNHPGRQEPWSQMVFQAARHAVPKPIYHTTISCQNQSFRRVEKLNFLPYIIFLF